MLDPACAELEDRARLEAPGAEVPWREFLTRSRRSIEKTAMDALSLVETVKYQEHLSSVHFALRVYSAPPIYRGVATNLGAVCSSYLDALDKPSRDFPMTRPSASDRFTALERTRFENWFDYVWRFRSRPFGTDVVLFDLYDTLVRVDEATRAAHRRQIAREMRVDEEVFASAWEGTRAASNRGELFGTVERFAKVLEHLGRDRDLALCVTLANMEHHHLSSMATPNARVTELLQDLGARGYKLGIVSNCSSSALYALAASQLTKFTDIQVLSFEVGTLKPAPEIYRTAIAALGSSPERVVFVGDGKNDELSGAAAAGLRAIRAAWFRDRAVAAEVPPAATLRELALMLDGEAEWRS